LTDTPPSFWPLRREVSTPVGAVRVQLTSVDGVAGRPATHEHSLR
jgi:hypothetical protein